MNGEDIDEFIDNIIGLIIIGVIIVTPPFLFILGLIIGIVVGIII